MGFFRFTEYLEYFWWVVLAIGVAMIVALIALGVGMFCNWLLLGCPATGLT